MISSVPSQALARLRPGEREAGAKPSGRGSASRKSQIEDQRRKGNGSIEDVAAFFDKSVRIVASWKKEEKIGHFQIGQAVWFSAENVSAFAVEHYHASKFSKTPAAEVKAQVTEDWKEFLGLQISNSRFESRLEKVERLLESFYPGAVDTIAKEAA